MEIHRSREVFFKLTMGFQECSIPLSMLTAPHVRFICRRQNMVVFWATICICAYCGLVGNPHLTAKSQICRSPSNVHQEKTDGSFLDDTPGSVSTWGVIRLLLGAHRK